MNERVWIGHLNWNRYQYTQVSLQNYLNNTSYPHHLWILDNGSTDETKSYLQSVENNKEYINRFPFKIDFKYFEKNMGYNYAIHWLVQNSLPETEYIGLVCNDSLVNLNWLNKYIELMDVVPQIAFCTPQERSDPDLTGLVDAQKMVINGRELWDRKGPLFGDEILIMRKEILQEMIYKGDYFKKAAETYWKESQTKFWIVEEAALQLGYINVSYPGDYYRDLDWGSGPIPSLKTTDYVNYEQEIRRLKLEEYLPEGIQEILEGEKK